MIRIPHFQSAGIAAALALILSPSFAEAAGNAPQPSICTRPCWGARAPQNTIYYMSALSRAIVHHTAGNEFNTTSLEDSKANVRGIQNLHMINNGWSDIGYHFLVDKFGYIFEGRYASMGGLPKGAHDGTNSNSFGFNVMGYFHPGVNNIPTAAMMNSLYDVIAWRMPNGWQPYGSPGTYGPLGNWVGYVDSHRRVKATACPGDHVHNPYIGNDVNAGTIRAEVKMRIDGVSDRFWYLRNSNSTGVADGSYKFGTTDDFPVVGDWNGDGYATAGFVRGRTWHLRNSNFGDGPADVIFDYGDPGDYFIVGDWNGDGIDTPGVVRGRTWYLRNYNSSGFANISLVYGDGLPGDFPVVGDWDGNGTDTPGIVRGYQWFLRNSNTDGEADISFYYGNIGDSWITGDWNGDGIDSPGLVRGNTWYLRNSNSGGNADLSFAYGNTGDAKLPGDWDGNGTDTPGVSR